MLFKVRKHFVWTLAIIFLLTQVFISPVFSQATAQMSNTMTSSKTMSASGTITDRIAGADRYQTAEAVSQQGWKTSDYAVLARGDHFADALCAGPLAQKYDGPILLTASNQLNADTLTELKRLGVKHLFIAGGVGAVSQSVEDALKAAGIANIERIYGDDRYETSVKIAEKVGNTGKVVLATGSDFPDALSISGIAAKLGMPILLTAKDTLPASVSSYLQTSTVTQTYVVGGTGVISENVASSVPSPARLAGGDRYATNVAIMQNFAGELNFDTLYVAIGTNFADALTGAVLAGKSSSPLVLTAQALPAVTANYLQTQFKLSSKVLGLGGSTVVPSSVLTGLVIAKEQIPVEEKYSTAGTYGPDTGTKTIQGSVIISARDVTLKNTIIEGDLLLGASIGDGNVTLRDVTVKGKTIINGGGPHSIILYNFNGQTVVVNVPDGGNVRLVAQGTTSLTGVSMGSDGTLEIAGTSGSGFVNVEIPAGVQVTFIGTFAQVSVEGSGASINLPTGSSITTLNANAASNITGQGQIGTANISTGGVTIERTPTSTTTVASGLTAMVGGVLVSGTNNAPASGGGGGDGGGIITITGYYTNNNGTDTALVTTAMVAYGTAEATAKANLSTAGYAKLSDNSYVAITIAWTFDAAYSGTTAGAKAVTGTVAGTFTGGQTPVNRTGTVTVSAPVSFTTLTANGTSGSVTTTVLTLTFDVDPTTLAASDITVTGATKGPLTGTGLTRTLKITGITVANGANVSVAIADPAGFTITPASKTVAVNVGAAVPIAVTATRDGVTTPLNTKVFATAGAGGTLKYKASSLSLAAPQYGSDVPSSTLLFTSGAEMLISISSSNTYYNYVQIYEIDANSKVVGYGEHQVTVGEMAPATFHVKYFSSKNTGTDLAPAIEIKIEAVEPTGTYTLYTATAGGSSISTKAHTNGTASTWTLSGDENTAYGAIGGGQKMVYTYTPSGGSESARADDGFIPLAPTGVTLTDTDNTYAGVDVRDFTFSWNTSTSVGDTSIVYVLPAAIPFGFPEFGWFSTSSTAVTFTHTLTNLTAYENQTASDGSALSAGSYIAYIIAVDNGGNKSAAAASAACDIVDP